MPGRISLHFGHNSPMESTSSLLAKRFGSNIDHHRPKSIPSRPSTRGVPATVNMTLESPPLVCYGHPKDSTGALMSGLLHLDVHSHSLRVESFKIVFQAEVLTRKPIAPHCPSCTARTEDIHAWAVISEAVTLAHGIHSYPFSYLIPGNLPATNSNALGRIRYFLHAVALSAQGEIKFSREIQISRAILPGPERHSVRIFPPTNLSAHVNLPHIVHPDGNFQLGIRLDGVLNETETRWRLRKLSWRIEESSKVISPSCPHHRSKLCGDGKGILHEDVCTVGSGELKDGWKADYSNGGRIEMEFMVGISAHMNAACDIESPCGIKVNHNLVVEMVVAEEHVSSICGSLPLRIHILIGYSGLRELPTAQSHQLVQLVSYACSSFSMCLLVRVSESAGMRSSLPSTTIFHLRPQNTRPLSRMLPSLVNLHRSMKAYRYNQFATTLNYFI